jgi:hypothetical protein
MQSDENQKAPDTDPRDAESAAEARAEAHRERFRQAQAIAAQIARARAAGGPPSADEAARLVAEFEARGGQVTVCPPPDTDPHRE